MLLLVLAFVATGTALLVGAGLATSVEKWRGLSSAYARAVERELDWALVPAHRGVTRSAPLIAVGIGAGIGLLAGESAWARLALSMCGGLTGYWVPWLVLQLFLKRRVRRVDEQLAPALTLMASALRAGLSLPQAIELAVREQPSPICDELALVAKEIRLGRRIDDALRLLPQRLPHEDVFMAVDAIVTLRETGGDLSASFKVIAETIVERKKVEGRIRVLTTEGMLQGVVMCLVPVFMFGAFALMDPNAITPLLTHPLGWGLLAVVAALTSTGFVVMRRIVRIDV